MPGCLRSHRPTWTFDQVNRKRQGIVLRAARYCGTGRATLLTVWLLFLAVATGCAALVEEQRLVREGWSVAWVDEVGVGDALVAKTSEDCRNAVSTANASRTYAAVTYWDHRNWVTRTVSVASESRLQVGDKVTVNTLDCRLPAFKWGETIP